MSEISEEQCNQYRAMPCSFNDMVKAIYRDSWFTCLSKRQKTLADQSLKYNRGLRLIASLECVSPAHCKLQSVLSQMCPSCIANQVLR